MIEALVAMAIMAFGMLAIVGVQSTLRLNNDTARQRSEAVRLAQQAIEDDRSFVDVAVPPVPGTVNYNSIPLAPPQIVDSNSGYTMLSGLVLPLFNSSTRYTLTTATSQAPAAPNAVAPSMMGVMVQVAWNDRANKPNSISLYTGIAGIAPSIAGSLGIAADVGRDGIATVPMMPQGRNAIIPTPAVDFGDGTSGYIPPGGGANGDGAAWLFNNDTGLITVCTTAIGSNDLLNSANQLTCAGGATAWLLSGTVDFAKDPDGLVATGADALYPSGHPFAVQVGFVQTFPTVGVGTASCYTTPPVGVLFGTTPYVYYLCAIPATSASNPKLAWSGYSYVTGAKITWAAQGFEVCRYTSVASDALVQSGAITNSQHPRTYWHVGKLLANGSYSGGLADQNFLIVPYVNGPPGWDCPSGAPLPANTVTYPQPPALQASAPNPP
ncbi:MAG: hypothetical protein KGL18_13395 [Burkholderiales bacterium]|nr:hypothetical protein [Burkholderiales bacterium]MDE1926665.1 hypothetical protein [Burkholderiales bacterium]MDE2160006.1 hypothetical protein [Burkholderiales bacterium]MDE2503954.1 hypothetical protein [Burkholderiales bacterium]